MPASRVEVARKADQLDQFARARTSAARGAPEAARAAASSSNHRGIVELLRRDREDCRAATAAHRSRTVWNVRIRPARAMSCGRARRDVSSGEHDAAAVEFLEAADAVDDGALARAVRADQAGHAARPIAKETPSTARDARERLVQVVHLEQRAHCSGRPHPGARRRVMQPAGDSVRHRQHRDERAPRHR